MPQTPQSRTPLRWLHCSGRLSLSAGNTTRHNFVLQLNHRHFITRQLYKYSYWLYVYVFCWVAFWQLLLNEYCIVLYHIIPWLVMPHDTISSSQHQHCQQCREHSFFCSQVLVMLKVKWYSSLCKTHPRATGRHLGSHNVICQLTQVNAPHTAPARKAGTWFSYPRVMKVWVCCWLNGYCQLPDLSIQPDQYQSTGNIQTCNNLMMKLACSHCSTSPVSSLAVLSSHWPRGFILPRISSLQHPGYRCLPTLNRQLYDTWLMTQWDSITTGRYTILHSDWRRANLTVNWAGHFLAGRWLHELTSSWFSTPTTSVVNRHCGFCRQKWSLRHNKCSVVATFCQCHTLLTPVHWSLKLCEHDDDDGSITWHPLWWPSPLWGTVLTMAAVIDAHNKRYYQQQDRQTQIQASFGSHLHWPSTRNL